MERVANWAGTDLHFVSYSCRSSTVAMLLPALNHIGSGHNPIVIALLCAVTQTPAQPGRQSSVLMSKPREWHAKSGKTSVSAFLINYKIWTDSRPCQEQHFLELVSFFCSSSLRIGGNCFNVGGEHDPTGMWVYFASKVCSCVSLSFPGSGRSGTGRQALHLTSSQYANFRLPCIYLLDSNKLMQF